MTNMTFDEAIKILEMQEEILQFNHFTNEDAWEVGNILVMEAHRRGYSIAISIRLNNDYIVFQYAADGTTCYDEKCLMRKHNTVRLMEKSTLQVNMLMQRDEETLADRFLDSKDYAITGGGFPIRVEEVGVIGSITVSGLDHVSDHDFIVKCLSRHLHIDEVPRIKTSRI